ncbi:ribonuclease H-like domain-containing protein [Tanacetum coccineum]
MRPFGCLVTILNTIDHLDKFDGKADEGFFIGYSTNSKAFRVFNIRTRIVEENLYVKFSEDIPNIAGSVPNWLFDIDALTNSMNYNPVVAGNQSNGNAGTKACDDAGKTRMETVHGKDYILLPLWTQDPPFSSSLKDSPDTGFKPLGEEEKKDAEDPGNEDSEITSTIEPRVNQEKDANVNNTNNIKNISLTVNATGIVDNNVAENIVYGYADDLNMPKLEEISRFSDAEDDISGADMNNLDTYFQVSPVPTTRIHKDHPIEQIIGDLNSAPQTRRMTRNLEEHRRTQKGSLSTEGSKLDRSYAGRAYTIQVTRSLDLARTPMETQKALLKDADGKDVDEHLYRSMIGSLMYLTSSRPDIMFAGKDFFGRDTPLFPTMTVQAQEQSRRKQRKDTEDPQLSSPTKPVINDTKNVASVPTHSNDPLLSGEDRLKLTELMKLCTKLAKRVLALETTKTNQALEIDSLKRRVNKLEKKKGGSRTHKLKRLYKVGRSARVVSSKDEGLGEQKDASKQGRKIDEIDQDAEVTLVDETQGRYDDNLMFDTSVLDNEQDMAEKEVDMAEKDVSTTDPVTTAGEVVTTTNVDSTTTTTVDELTLAQTLIEIKAAKPKAITTAATTTTTAVTKPKARGGLSDIMIYKEVAQKLQAQLDAELEEEEKLARQREEDANITEWDNVQAMMDIRL